LSAITWSGFDNFYYFFSHEDSRDEFEIPHDLKILKEVFDVDPGEYRRSNAFWQSHGIQAWMKENGNELDQRYDQASNHYQSGKADNQIPLN